jgi:folate-dependent phosphoribosylglycinamide formyltransferase PurN
MDLVGSFTNGIRQIWPWKIAQVLQHKRATSSKTKSKFVLITSGGRSSELLSRFLSNYNCHFEIVTAHCLPPKRRAGEGLVRHWRALIEFRLKSNSLLRAIARRKSPVFAKKPVNGGFLNSPRLIKTLQQLSPDYILLRDIGIVDRQVIQTARIGVLNAHPGLLPWIRGVDAVSSSLLEGIATGATVHFVNGGIDTGAIISRHLLPAHSGEQLESLKQRANGLALLALVEAILRIERGESLKGEVQSERFALHTRLNKDQLCRASGMAGRGRAKDLYERWRLGHQEIRDGASILAKHHSLLKAPIQSETGETPGRTGVLKRFVPAFMARRLFAGPLHQQSLPEKGILSWFHTQTGRHNQLAANSASVPKH